MDFSREKEKTVLEVRPNKPLHIIGIISGLFVSIFFFGMGIFLLVYLINADSIDVGNTVGLVISVSTSLLFASVIFVLCIVLLIGLLCNRDVYSEEKMCRMRKGKVIFEIKYSNIDSIQFQNSYLFITCKSPYKSKGRELNFSECYRESDAKKIFQLIQGENPFTDFDA